MSRAKGDVVVIDEFGVAIPSSIITFKDTDGSSAYAQALYAADSGGSSTTSHLTTAKGELTRYTPLAQRAFYRIGTDTVNWPVDFEVDPADVIALADDGVTMTNGYRTLARLRVAAIEAQIRDTGGWTFHLESFAANGVNIRGTSPTEDPNAAWVAAFAAITAAGGGMIVLGPYTYLPPKGSDDAGPTWPDNCVVRGAGIDATIILHRSGKNSAYSIPVNFFQRTDCGVCDLTVDGNYTNVTAYTNGEVVLDGTRNWAFHIKVTNFNGQGITYSGIDNTVSSCQVIGLAPASYTYSGTAANNNGNLQGFYGINSPATTAVCLLCRLCFFKRST